MVVMPLNAPFALAAHLPPNLTTLKLQYLPAAWPSDTTPRDEYEVCQPAHPASCPPTTDLPPWGAPCHVCFDSLHSEYVIRMPRSTRGIEYTHATCASRLAHSSSAYGTQSETGHDAGWGSFIGGVLQSLPSLDAPLRYLCLQRGHKTPFIGAVTSGMYSVCSCVCFETSRVLESS